MKRQKDVEARWTEKNGQKHYGYKDHLVIDNEHKRIRDFEVTSAEVHDSQVFFELLSENTSKEVWADGAYRSEENELMLKTAARFTGKVIATGRSTSERKGRTAENPKHAPALNMSKEAECNYIALKKGTTPLGRGLLLMKDIRTLAYRFWLLPTLI